MPAVPTALEGLSCDVPLSGSLMVNAGRSQVWIRVEICVRSAPDQSPIRAIRRPDQGQIRVISEPYKGWIRARSEPHHGQIGDTRLDQVQIGAVMRLDQGQSRTIPAPVKGPG